MQVSQIIRSHHTMAEERCTDKSQSTCAHCPDITEESTHIGPQAANILHRSFETHRKEQAAHDLSRIMENHEATL